MEIVVKRSPARVCWHILVNGTLLETAETKAEAEAQASYWRKRYA